MTTMMTNDELAQAIDQARETCHQFSDADLPYQHLLALLAVQRARAEAFFVPCDFVPCDVCAATMPQNTSIYDVGVEDP